MVNSSHGPCGQRLLSQHSCERCVSCGPGEGLGEQTYAGPRSGLGAPACAEGELQRKVPAASSARWAVNHTRSLLPHRLTHLGTGLLSPLPPPSRALCCSRKEITSGLEMARPGRNRKTCQPVMLWGLRIQIQGQQAGQARKPKE